MKVRRVRRKFKTVNEQATNAWNKLRSDKMISHDKRQIRIILKANAAY